MWTLGCAALVAATVLGAPCPARADPAPISPAVVDWNMVAAEAIGAWCLVPGHDDALEGRAFASVQLAVHDALNSIEGRFERSSHPAPTPSASPAMAIAAATRTVLIRLLDDRAGVPHRCTDDARAVVEAAYGRTVRAAPQSPAKRAGLLLGEAAGRAVLQGFAGGRVHHGLIADRQLVAARPYPESSVEYARDFQEVQTLGGDGVHTPSARTPDQTETARFWRRSPAQVWNSIARSVAVSARLDDWDTARLFALLDLALADAADLSTATRYTTNYWTPVSAIRSADTDANRETRADRRWTPLYQVALTGGYDSAQAVAAGSAAGVLRTFLGSDVRTFSACRSPVEEVGTTCDSDGSISRTFHSFSQAANESGWSEILAGVHFRRAVRSGLDRGTRIAEAVYARQLAPVELHTTGKNGCAASHHRARLMGLVC